MISRSKPCRPSRWTAAVASLVAVFSIAASLPLVAGGPAAAATAPVGQGFSVTPGDLKFILKQIKIAERHAATATSDNPCGTLIGSGPTQVPDGLTPYGLRTVDGSCNNLQPGRSDYGSSGNVFPRLASATFDDAENSSPEFGPPRGSSYRQTTGSVFDRRPRMTSNLIADQTSRNPAAVSVAGSSGGVFGGAGYVPCTTDPDPVAGTDGSPAGCVPSGMTLPIPNVSADLGLSPPFNGVLTLFGQFFDHGIDLTDKGSGTVFVPLRDDDPLVRGRDGQLGTADDLPTERRFMVLSRARYRPGPDGQLGTADDVKDAENDNTPWVDQSQSYGSHPAQQVFLREYELVDGRPVDTGRLLGDRPGSDQRAGLATWGRVKSHAAGVLGLKLTDSDVKSIPLLATDPYGNFLPGPNGLPQYVTDSGLVEGDLADPVPVPTDGQRAGDGFLLDIPRAADPTLSAAYDGTLLDALFVAGDGRVNENIGLTAIHQVFHSEHNRLVADIKQVLETDTSSAGAAALADWRNGVATGGWSYGQRLFQAARFINEMEYQHIVFEEFARKIQPGLGLFTGYQPDVDPAVSAEFAHSVYRFGHSMLTDTISRTSARGRNYSIPLLDGFLSPREYLSDGNGGTLTAEAAAGGILMGMSDQAGNEIDEFVGETLRNNLLGLPLDLATLNITRGRSEGIPSLNDFRQRIFDQTRDGQLTPYTSWADFGQNLKHPQSLVNFVAAYGTHPTLRDSGPDGDLGTSDDVTTVTAKREAAQEIVNPVSGVSPTADQLDFLNSTGEWADSASGADRTGIDDVDLWIGGLAEATQPFGSMLGSTFTYVFENQLVSLQDGDRFYYLSRLEGLNLFGQVEGNTFAELVMRNTDNTKALKADAFARTDCVFELGNLSGTVAGYAAQGSTVSDDPESSCNESALLLRKPDGTLQYRGTNTVDPAGTNAQSVYNGSSGSDRVYGGNDNDTLWGNGGADQLEGGGGDDVTIGGEGDDWISDAFGLDVLMGGPGDDAMDGGTGNDILLGGDGRDFTNGGANDNETFSGPGDDFSIGGTGADTVFGGGGDDWSQGGAGSDVLVGDHGAPFLDDPGERLPGSDILVGQGGDNVFEAEGGDDVMAQGLGVDRNIGAGGFDWVTHQFATVGADDDLLINGGIDPETTPGGVIANRDRWLETEAVSGSDLADVIRGDHAIPWTTGGPGAAGCNALDQAGVDRVTGLSEIMPPLVHDPAETAALSAAGSCPLSGPVWGDGNILLGGGGDDTLEGRGGDDILDGDRKLVVRISVRVDPADPATEIGTTDRLDLPFQEGNAKTLQHALFDGSVKPRQLVMVREVVATTDQAVDTAVYSGNRSDYLITAVDGVLEVTQTGPDAEGQDVSDGTDTLRNIERLQFADRAFLVRTPGAATVGSATTSGDSATLTWTPPVDTGGPLVTGFELAVLSGGVPVSIVTGISSTTNTWTVSRLTPGTTYTFQVRAVNAFGPGGWSAESNPVTPSVTLRVPDAPTGVTAARANTSAQLSWTPPAGDGGSPITSYRIQVRTGTTVVRTVTGVAGTTTSTTVTGLTNGTAYNFRVQAVNSVGNGALSTPSGTVVPSTVPGAPRIGRASAGTAGGAITATAVWQVPLNTGGSPITGYVVRALRMSSSGAVLSTTTSEVQPRSASRIQMVLPTNGSYRFTVQAINVDGAGPQSARSNAVVGR